MSGAFAAVFMLAALVSLIDWSDRYIAWKTWRDGV